MSRVDLTARLIDAGVIAVVRIEDPDKLRAACEAMVSGGVIGIEITMSVPDAIDVIRALAAEFGDSWLIGAGSVRDAETAARAADAGARYVVSPVFVQGVIDAAHRADVPACVGAYTPTEIHHASDCGADIVKVFPADFLGMKYFKALLAPMPELKMMPTGGVTIENGGEWIEAGAVAVGVGSALLNNDLLARGDWAALQSAAQRLKGNVEAARAAKGA